MMPRQVWCGRGTNDVAEIQMRNAISIPNPAVHDRRPKGLSAVGDHRKRFDDQSRERQGVLLTAGTMPRVGRATLPAIGSTVISARLDTFAMHVAGKVARPTASDVLAMNRRT